MRKDWPYGEVVILGTQLKSRAELEREIEILTLIVERCTCPASEGLRAPDGSLRREGDTS